MEMCYDGALVMPSNYAVMDEEEMTYVEGGGSITINRKTIDKALSSIWSAIGSVSTVAWLTNKSAAQIGAKIAGAAFKVGKALLSVSGFAGFALQAAAAALAGVVAACALTIGIVYATNSTMKLKW